MVAYVYCTKRGKFVDHMVIRMNAHVQTTLILKMRLDCLHTDLHGATRDLNHSIPSSANGVP